MPRKYSGEGVIQVLCPWCGRMISYYDLGNKYNREKYGGSPYPRKILTGSYDVKINDDGTFHCPFCGAKLRIIPKKIVFLKYSVYNRNVVVDYEGRRVFVLSRKLRDMLGLAQTGEETSYTGVASGLHPVHETAEDTVGDEDLSL